MDLFAAPFRRGLLPAGLALGRYLLRGLSLLSYANPASMAAMELHVRQRGEPEPVLPPGHPERLVPDVPPSPAERHLWSELALNGPDLDGLRESSG